MLGEFIAPPAPVRIVPLWPDAALSLRFSLSPDERTSASTMRGGSGGGGGSLGGLGVLKHMRLSSFFESISNWVVSLLLFTLC